jgi:hypothetical protein
MELLIFFHTICHLMWSWNSMAGKVIIARAGSTGNSYPGRGRRLFSSPKYRDWLWGPPSLLLNGNRDSRVLHWEESGWVMEFTIRLHAVLRLRMSGAIPLHPPTCFHGVDRDDFSFLPLLCHFLQSLNQAPEIQHYLQHTVIFTWAIYTLPTDCIYVLYDSQNTQR